MNRPHISYRGLREGCVGTQILFYICVTFEVYFTNLYNEFIFLLNCQHNVINYQNIKSLTSLS